MRKSNSSTYDGNVTVTTGTMTSAPEFNGLMGEGNQIAFQILVDLVSGTTPTFTFRMQHSADQINWVNRNTNPEVNAQSISAGQINSFLVQDAGATPMLGYVRFQVSVAGTSAQAHVKVWVTTRDNA